MNSLSRGSRQEPRSSVSATWCLLTRHTGDEAWGTSQLYGRGAFLGINRDHWKRTSYIEGIPPKGPYLPCVCMAGRALLTGYPRYQVGGFTVDVYGNIRHALVLLSMKTLLVYRALCLIRQVASDSPGDILKHSCMKSAVFRIKFQRHIFTDAKTRHWTWSVENPFILDINWIDCTLNYCYIYALLSVGSACLFNRLSPVQR